jgi:hypothetical protein
LENVIKIAKNNIKKMGWDSNFFLNNIIIKDILFREKDMGKEPWLWPMDMFI